MRICLPLMAVLDLYNLYYVEKDGGQSKKEGSVDGAEVVGSDKRPLVV